MANLFYHSNQPVKQHPHKKYKKYFKISLLVNSIFFVIILGLIFNNLM